MWRDSNGAGLPGRLYGGQYQRIEPRRARLTIASNMIAPASETRNVMAVSGELLMSPRERIRPPMHEPIMQTTIRSEERRVGKECVRTYRSRGPRLHEEKNTNRRIKKDKSAEK